MSGYIPALVIAALVSVAGIGANSTFLRTINVQSQFLRWPNPSAIPHYIDKAYTLAEQDQIKAAIKKVTADLSGCVGFVQIAPTSADFKVKITPFQEDGTTPEQYCNSFPGYYKDNGKNEQRLVLSRSPTGCFDGNMRSLMKYFAVLLGKRNEHQRPDRDQFITMDNNCIQANNVSKLAYRLYSAAEAYSGAFPYDYCSVTHNRVTDFCSKAFSVNKEPFFIPAYSRLSNTDCQLISLLYPGCDRKKCEPLNCAGLTTPVPVVTSTIIPANTLVCTTVPATTVATTTLPTTTPELTTIPLTTIRTTAPTTITPLAPCVSGEFKDFCMKAPTSSMLFEVGATPTDDVYVLMSGNCAMLYKIGQGNGNQALIPVKDGEPNPIDLGQLFPGYDGWMTPPVTFSYIDGPYGLVYLSNGKQPTRAAACPFPNTAGVACDGSTFAAPFLPLSLATSAPKPGPITLIPHDQFFQIFQDDGPVVLLCMSNTGRPIASPTPANCLDIAVQMGAMDVVTALQYVNDPVSPGILLFGFDTAEVPLIAFGDFGASVPFPEFHPITAPTAFDTYGVPPATGGAFPVLNYTVGVC